MTTYCRALDFGCKAYVLTTLYNAPATMGNFYSAKVNHDFNGW